MRMRTAWLVAVCVLLALNVAVMIACTRYTETFVQPSTEDNADAIPYDVLRVPDVLTEDECKRLIEHADAGDMFESKVWTGDASKPDDQSSHRTSKQKWVAYDDPDIGPIVRKLRNKAAQLSGVYDPASFEKVQLAKYNADGEYRQHFDSCTSKCPNNKLCRTATLLVYLNEPASGGHTVFPNIGVSVAPKVGHGTFFYNVDTTDNDHPELNASMHAGAPVQAGKKYIANVWITCKKQK